MSEFQLKSCELLANQNSKSKVHMLKTLLILLFLGEDSFKIGECFDFRNFFLGDNLFEENARNEEFFKDQTEIIEGFKEFSSASIVQENLFDAPNSTPSAQTEVSSYARDSSFWKDRNVSKSKSSIKSYSSYGNLNKLSTDWKDFAPFSNKMNADEYSNNGKLLFLFLILTSFCYRHQYWQYSSSCIWTKNRNHIRRIDDVLI